ncbi:MAG TPA: HAD hydrolase-like protein [Gemmatimonadaceae bacterium]|nr:HAD hydrolase-like protein [Gemmatimonadaceae bacterium]
MPDAVLLEWEAVLADTGSARRDALLRALADEGVPWTAAAYDACCGGLDVRAAAARGLAAAGRDDATLADIVALRANRAFGEWLSRGFVLQPDVREQLEAMEPRTRLAIVTRAGRAETETALRLVGLDRSVGIVVTADEVTDLPPAPELYERALMQLARSRPVRAERVVAVVRAPDAAASARAAGIRTVHSLAGIAGVPELV